jgi:hypothetical protein
MVLAAFGYGILGLLGSRMLPMPGSAVLAALGRRILPMLGGGGGGKSWGGRLNWILGSHRTSLPPSDALSLFAASSETLPHILPPKRQCSLTSRRLTQALSYPRVI